MRLLLIILVLIIASCGGMRSIQEPVRPGDLNVKIVTGIQYHASLSTWRNSRYWRLEDTTWPWLVVVSDNAACPVFQQIVNEPRRSEYYKCPVPWRFPRP